MATKANRMIKDFTDTEKWTVQQTLNERWVNDKVEIQLADVDVRLRPGDRELSTCPALFWEVGGSNFVIIKIGPASYKTQFYYKGRDQYGTAVPSFDNIHDCIVTVLQVHTDLELGKKIEKESD
jgi:hypothetical protein